MKTAKSEITAWKAERTVWEMEAKNPEIAESALEIARVNDAMVEIFSLLES